MKKIIGATVFALTSTAGVAYAEPATESVILRVQCHGQPLSSCPPPPCCLVPPIIYEWRPEQPGPASPDPTYFRRDDPPLVDQGTPPGPPAPPPGSP